MKQMLKGALLHSGKIEVDGRVFSPIKVEKKTKTAIVKMAGKWVKVKLSQESAPRERDKKHRSRKERDAEEMQMARKYAKLMESGKIGEAEDVWVELAYGAQLHPVYPKQKPLPDWERRLLERVGMLKDE